MGDPIDGTAAHSRTSLDDDDRAAPITRPDDPDAPARGVDETDEPIPEPNEPA
jgi:hypothetical protein